MKAIKALIILIVIVAAGVVAYAYSGMYNVSVGTGHNAVTRWLLETTRERSVESRSEDLAVPADLDSQDRIAEGAEHFNRMCSGCHGRPGKEPSDHFDPRPPALSRFSPEPKEAFWVIRNGLKMSAMPSHPDHSDEEIWNIVAFLQKQPQLSEEQYKALVEQAGHHEEEGTQKQRAVELPDDPVTAVDEFHQALAGGNGEVALALLHDKATLLEEGQIQSKQEYAEHHLGEDMKFMAQAKSEQLSREQRIEGRQATVTTRSHLTGTYEGKPVDVVLDENMSLYKTSDGWIITHVQWSPEPKKEATDEMQDAGNDGDG